MQSHRGLPRNVPQRRTKARIFSPSVSPAKSTDSPVKSSNESPCKTPGRQGSLSQSRHRLKSKQKPTLCLPIDSKSNNKSFVAPKEFSNGQETVKSQMPRPQTQFLQEVLGMMSNLNKKNETSSTIEPSREKGRRKEDEKKPHLKHQRITGAAVIGPVLQQSAQPITMPSDEQLLARSAEMLRDPGSWLSFNGEVSRDQRTGYGIQYFKNKDKFMGRFEGGKAAGHGTYYFHDVGKRLMAVWQDNELNFDNGYIIEKL